MDTFSPSDGKAFWSLRTCVYCRYARWTQGTPSPRAQLAVLTPLGGDKLRLYRRYPLGFFWLNSYPLRFFYLKPSPPQVFLPKKCFP